MAATQKERLLAYVLTHPDMDDDQLAARLRISPRQTVNTLARELVKSGAIVRVGSSSGKIVNRAVGATEEAGTGRVLTAELRALVRRWIDDDALAETWARRREATTEKWRSHWLVGGEQVIYREFVLFDGDRQVRFLLHDSSGEKFGFNFKAADAPHAVFALGVTGPGREYAPSTHAVLSDGQLVLRFPPRSQRGIAARDISASRSDFEVLDDLLAEGFRVLAQTATKPAARKPKLPADYQDVGYAMQMVRKAQGAFRGALMAAYDGRCALSGTAIPQLLTAAHIVPWKDCRGTSLANDVANGLLLRVDLHLLFDHHFFDLVPAGAGFAVKILREIDHMGLRDGQRLRRPLNEAEAPAAANFERRLLLGHGGI